jgi:sec-independent protein translocase protein TatC
MPDPAEGGGEDDEPRAASPGSEEAEADNVDEGTAPDGEDGAEKKQGEEVDRSSPSEEEHTEADGDEDGDGDNGTDGDQEPDDEESPPAEADDEPEGSERVLDDEDLPDRFESDDGGEDTSGEDAQTEASTGNGDDEPAEEASAEESKDETNTGADAEEPAETPSEDGAEDETNTVDDAEEPAETAPGDDTADGVDESPEETSGDGPEMGDAKRQALGPGRNPHADEIPPALDDQDVEDGEGDGDGERVPASNLSGPGGVESEDGLGGITGHAPDDQEQPLEAHITEMVHRFLAVAVVIVGVGAIALLWSDDLINFLWYSFLGPGGPLCPGQECPQIYKPHLYHPLSLLLARLKVAVLVGFVVGLPVAVYQTYLFMRPGLYPHERRYYLAAVPTSLVLATIGVGFAYLLVLPALFSYFVGYTTRAAEPALGLAETFNIIVILLGFFALIFQIPLLVMLAIMMGVTTRRWLEDRRLYFWMGFGGVAFIFSPDPTGMAPLLVALTMIGLFEGTLALLRWTGEDSPILAPAPLRARRPYAWAFAALVGYGASAAPLPGSYYGQLPTVLTRTLADLGWTAGTPLIVAGAIVVGFELLRYLLRRLGVGLRTQLWILRARWPVWIAAALIGYLAGPRPGLLAAARETSLALPWVLAIALGIAVAYEVLIQLVAWRRGT